MIDTMTPQEVERMEFLQFRKEKEGRKFPEERKWELEELEKRHKAMGARIVEERKESKSQQRRKAAQKEVKAKTKKKVAAKQKQAARKKK